MNTSLLPSVAIVILNYNGRKYLERFLPAVLASTYPNKTVMVADNASSDDSVRWLKDSGLDVRIILLDKNYGFAEGYNRALAQTEADYFVLLNSDIEVTPGWIEPVIALMESDPATGACQPKILSYQHRDQFEYAGAAGGWIDYLGYPLARGRVFSTLEKDHGQYEDDAYIFWGSGAALFVKAGIWKLSGGLDPYFFAHQEEIDFCWRLQRMGYRIRYCHQSVVYHIGGGTLPQGSYRKAFLNFRNNLIMLAKNLPRTACLYILPVRLFLDGVFAVKSLLVGDFLPLRAVFCAHLAFYRWLLFVPAEKRFPRKKMRNLDGVIYQSVVKEYFLLKRQTFSEICRLKQGK